MKLLETILRERTGSDQKLPCSEIKRAGWNPQERRLLTQGWRDVGKGFDLGGSRRKGNGNWRERLFPLKIRIRRQFNFVFHKPKVKIRKTEPNKAEVCHTSKPPPWLLRRELGTQIQRDRPKCPRAQQAYS